MNILKKTLAVAMALVLCFCVIGCEDDVSYPDYDNFEPAGVYINDFIGGEHYKTDIEDAEFAQKMFDKFDSLEINTEKQGEIDAAYLYLRFYNQDKSTLIIFSIYENGSCCLGEQFGKDEIYTVENGRQAYIDLCSLYESYEG